MSKTWEQLAIHAWMFIPSSGTPSDHAWKWSWRTKKQGGVSFGFSLSIVMWPCLYPDKCEMVWKCIETHPSARIDPTAFLHIVATFRMGTNKCVEAWTTLQLIQLINLRNWMHFRLWFLNPQYTKVCDLQLPVHVHVDLFDHSKPTGYKSGDKHRASQGPVFRLNSKRHENTIDRITNQSVLCTISLRKGMINKHQHKDKYWKEIEPHHIS